MGGIFLISENPFPKVVNLSVTSLCNYKCKFCFGRFMGLTCWPDDSRTLEIPALLSEAGTEKLTITGGEPFLYPNLDLLLSEAKMCGLTTSVVTNGSFIYRKWLDRMSPYLDWLAISIDSQLESTEIAIGRGNGNHVKNAIKVSRWVHELGICLKTNTVVTRLNYREDITSLLMTMKPLRAKIFQMLPIGGENHDLISELKISLTDFMQFVNRHKALMEHGIKIIPETSQDMTGSYAMMLPDGTFFNNYGGRHIYGKHSIFDIGPENALAEVGWDQNKFLSRGGLYKWGLKEVDENVKRR